jgi:preprotein translocase subunit SecF
MTSNWMMMLIWMLVGAISTIELIIHYGLHGFGHYSTWLFAVLLMMALFYVFKYRKLRNNEKLNAKKK